MAVNKREHTYHRRGELLRHIRPRERGEGRNEVADCALLAWTALEIYDRSRQQAWAELAGSHLDHALEKLCRRGGCFAEENGLGKAAVYPAANALMLAALARGGRVLGEERYLRAARTLRVFLKTRLTDPQGFLYRFWRDREAVGQGHLEDYALYILALIALYEADGSRFCLREAMHLTDQMAARFGGQIAAQ